MCLRSIWQKITRHPGMLAVVIPVGFVTVSSIFTDISQPSKELQKFRVLKGNWTLSSKCIRQSWGLFQMIFTCCLLVMLLFLVLMRFTKRTGSSVAGLDYRFVLVRFVVTAVDNNFGRKWINSRRWAANWTVSRQKKEWYRVRFNLERSRAALLPSTLTLQEWLFLVTLYGYRCAFCGCVLSQKKTSIEHLVPISLAGGTVFSNVVPCCRFCNCGRSQMSR